MVIRKTTSAEINLLIQLRMDYLLDQNKKENLGNMEALEGKLRTYFTNVIQNGTFAAVVAEEEDKVYSAAFLSIADRPPRSAEVPCAVGTVYNVYTYPEYRRRGLATKVMEKLHETAGELGLGAVDLLASEDGKPVYEKLGYRIPEHTYMRRRV